MAAATAAAGHTYVDFVPPHSLLEEPDNVVLRVDLAAEGLHTLSASLYIYSAAWFKKEQLRVQIDRFGRLRVSGERPLRADSNHWRRFSRDFQVPEGCDAGAIRARLDKGGLLLITMPRLSNAGGVDAQDQQKDHTSSAQQEAAPADEAGEENKKDHKEDAGGASTEHRDQDEQHDHDTSNGAGGAASAGQKTAYAYGSAMSRRGVIWAIVAVMLALVGAGLYARYRLMDPSAETASAGTQIVALSDN
ncbi:hypothetical protein PR202_gb18643 [Eleusine coracana subsp. coracana]|uniref:SHSP domain-containing protein n=1 Tax=Eleusine coracana subsp. coracana TaxID=191504 RepID=A0AAV5F654_ELECO|nr:hypothetical protein PR202_gb18643 [Eleusine coracana subsp. coracana]